MISERADQLLDEGGMAGVDMWHRILDAIERLQVEHQNRNPDR